MTKRKSQVRVYYLPNLDGTYAAMVSARNQREACQLLQCTTGEFRRYGGHCLTPDERPAHAELFRIAISTPGSVWFKKLGQSSGKGWDSNPWVLNRYTDDKAARLEVVKAALADGPDFGTTWCHCKTGGLYRVESCGILESSMTPVVVYSRVLRKGEPALLIACWVRPLAEFMDGRFVMEDV